MPVSTLRNCQPCSNESRYIRESRSLACDEANGSYFVRTSELIGARWAEFRPGSRPLDIPAERMKMRTPHIVPMARQALEVLEMLHDLTGHSEWLFPGDRNASKPMSNNTILKALERMVTKVE